MKSTFSDWHSYAKISWRTFYSTIITTTILSVVLTTIVIFIKNIYDIEYERIIDIEQYIVNSFSFSLLLIMTIYNNSKYRHARDGHKNTENENENENKKVELIQLSLAMFLVFSLTIITNAIMFFEFRIVEYIKPTFVLDIDMFTYIMEKITLASILIGANYFIIFTLLEENSSKSGSSGDNT